MNSTKVVPSSAKSKMAELRASVFYLRDLVDELSVELVAEVVNEAVEAEARIEAIFDEDIGLFDLNNLDFEEENETVTLEQRPGADDANVCSTSTFASNVAPSTSTLKRTLQPEICQDDYRPYLKYIKENKNPNTNRKTNQVSKY